jgi:hypothetical protein
MSETKKDPIVDQVVKKFQDRSEIGIKKYGTTLAESKEGFIPFLNHLQEELMDAILYIQKLKSENKMTKEELVKIIKDNFTNEDGDIDIRGLKFDTNIYLSRMKVDGDLRQDNQRVKGHLHQDSQKVEGHLFQSFQKVEGNLYQRYQEVEGDLF